MSFNAPQVPVNSRIPGVLGPRNADNHQADRGILAKRCRGTKGFFARSFGQARLGAARTATNACSLSSAAIPGLRADRFANGSLNCLARLPRLGWSVAEARILPFECKRIPASFAVGKAGRLEAAKGYDSFTVKPARWREGVNFQAVIARFSTAKLLLAAAPLFSIIIARAEARKPGIACSDSMCQRIPPRFMRAAARVLLAASTAPELIASF